MNKALFLTVCSLFLFHKGFAHVAGSFTIVSRDTLKPIQTVLILQYENATSGFLEDKTEQECFGLYVNEDQMPFSIVYDAALGAHCVDHSFSLAVRMGEAFALKEKEFVETILYSAQNRMKPEKVLLRRNF